MGHAYCFIVLDRSCVTFIVVITSGAAGLADPSGVNTYDDEFRSQFLQDYIEATLHSIRYSTHIQPCN